MNKQKPRQKSEANAALPDGLAVRLAAVQALSLVIYEKRFLEDALTQTLKDITDPRDRAFAHVLSATALRHKGQIEAVLTRYMEQRLPARYGYAHNALICGVAQLLFMRTQVHAAISTSVTIVAKDKKNARYKGLVNAVLRNVAEHVEAISNDMPEASCNLPKWLSTRLRADYGPDVTSQIAEAHTKQANTDLTLKIAPVDDSLLALGELLPTGSLRLASGHPAIPDIPGYSEGNWWVQDAAAALPVKLFGQVKGKVALDMCCAPGGKTMQLAGMGAQVTAIDVSEVRMEKVAKNLSRTGLSANCVVTDVLELPEEEKFDLILLDAPCSATGTIRRHPDMPFIRNNEDVKKLIALQRTLLRKAKALLSANGTLVYTVCSMLANEGPKQVAAFLNENKGFVRLPIDSADSQIPADFISKSGDLRTLPHQNIGRSKGLDGFFAAKLVRKSD